MTDVLHTSEDANDYIGGNVQLFQVQPTARKDIIVVASFAAAGPLIACSYLESRAQITQDLLPPHFMAQLLYI